MTNDLSALKEFPIGKLNKTDIEGRYTGELIAGRLRIEILIDNMNIYLLPESKDNVLLYRGKEVKFSVNRIKKRLDNQ